MPGVKAFCLALGVQAAGALRRSTGKAVAGVPILNYRYRHLQTPQVGAADGTFDWVLKFQSGVDDQQIADFCGSACGIIGHPSTGGLPMATVRATEEQLEKMLWQWSSMVEWLEPDTPVRIDEPTIEEAMPENAPWGHERIGLSQSAFTGEGVHIYVMDTGIRVSHADFEGRAIPTIQTTVDTVQECNGDHNCAQDTHGHGTHCAGTAGGRSYGVAKRAYLHAMRVCCTGSNTLGGMDWLTQNRILPAVMSMSIGSPATPESSRVAVDAVVASGIPVIVSAGNSATPSCLKSYTFIRSAIGVAASDAWDRRASFSNYGECNFIFAPGVRIVSASHSSDTGSAWMSGTSMAQPHVAGVSALLLHEDPSRSPEEVRHLLQERAQRGELSGLKKGDPNLLLWAGNAPAPTPPTPPPGTWVLTGSGCEMDGDCVQSLNHPSNYGDREQCSIELGGDIPLRVESFETDYFDYLTVGGVKYWGDDGPSNGTYFGTITWSSDWSGSKSGWRLCRTD